VTSDDAARSPSSLLAVSLHFMHSLRPLTLARYRDVRRVCENGVEARDGNVRSAVAFDVGFTRRSYRRFSSPASHRDSCHSEKGYIDVDETDSEKVEILIVLIRIKKKITL
jgi:hypothetical protein